MDRCGSCDHPQSLHEGTDGDCLRCDCPAFDPAARFEAMATPCEQCGHTANVHEGPENAVKWCLTCSCPEFIRSAVVGYRTKDSGKRVEFDSGMVRDTAEDKARFELLLPLGVPYRDQFLVRVAELLARGAVKYQDRNWEKAQGDEEMERFKSSAIRHLMQWAAGEDDEDHAAAVVFNLLGYETVKWKRGK